MTIIRTICALLGLALSSAATAEWREITTRHFVVYGEDSPEKLEAAARKLEGYDHLLRLTLDVPSEPSTRVKVYLLKNLDEVQKSMGYGVGTGVAGYYRASARGAMAVGTRLGASGANDIDSQIVLYHEYAHHLMLQHFAGFYPWWFTEGFAEYYGTARILPGNVMEVGIPARHRRETIDYAGWLPVKKLVTARSLDDIDGRIWNLYAEGWLLVHYLNHNPDRAGQLRRYLLAINKGIDLQTAMNEAFGQDGAALNDELRAYARKNRLEALRISFEILDVGPISVRTLRAAEADMLGYDIALGRGVFARHLPRFVADVRKAAALHPDDPYALSILAEAEHLAGNSALAVAAADRWIAVSPAEPRAITRKAMATIVSLQAAGDGSDRSWSPPLQWLTEARQAAPDDPLVLEAFYDGYAARGSLPPGRAQNALFRAMELVPQDERLRYKVAADFERRNLLDAAIEAISPAAFSAHDPSSESKGEKKVREAAEEKWRHAGVAKVESPREMLARLEALKSQATEGKPAAQRRQTAETTH